MPEGKSDFDEDELRPSSTEGYRAPPSRTVDELKQLDQNDESLRKWKEALLAGAPLTAASDTRRVAVLQMAMEVDGRRDVQLSLDSPAALALLRDRSLTIKEGVDYRLKIQFTVQNDVVAGLKYLQVVKRKGITVDKIEEMIGSYAPSDKIIEKKFAPEQAPSGLLARGHYCVRSRFIDDDQVCHLDFTWNFDIKKEWDNENKDE